MKSIGTEGIRILCALRWRNEHQLMTGDKDLDCYDQVTDYLVGRGLIYRTKFIQLNTPIYLYTLSPLGNQLLDRLVQLTSA